MFALFLWFALSVPLPVKLTAEFAGPVREAPAGTPDLLPPGGR
jgi:hypothetical protein